MLGQLADLAADAGGEFEGRGPCEEEVVWGDAWEGGQGGGNGHFGLCGDRGVDGTLVGVGLVRYLGLVARSLCLVGLVFAAYALGRRVLVPELGYLRWVSLSPSPYWLCGI